VGRIPTADGGREAHGAEGRIHFRAVHNVVSVKYRKVRGLSKTSCESGKNWLHPNVVGPQFVIDKCQAQKFVAEHVVATAIFVSQACFAERRECPVHSRFRARHCASHIVKARSIRELCQLDENGEHAVRAHESDFSGLAYGVT
jgi:hypothetical protein